MPILPWRPREAGGVNLDDSLDQIPQHQLQVCDNYYPYRGRWRLIEGNSALALVAQSSRTRHLAEFLRDDAAGGTVKYMLRMRTNGSDARIDRELDGTAVILTGSPVLDPSVTALWDTTNWQSTLYLANGLNNLMQITSADPATIAAVAGSPPSLPRYVEAWKNRLLIAGRNAAPQSVHYSAESDATTWTGNDAGTEIITTPHGDFVTCIRSVENYFAIFTNLTITVLVGDHPDDWTKRTLFEDHGASSHRTVHRVNGGLVYANDFGVFLLTADLKRVELSKDIRGYWQNLNASASRRNKARSSFMHAVYDPNPETHRYYIWVAEGTSTKEDVCWIFHFNSGEWSRMVTFMDSGQTCQASCIRENSSGSRHVHFVAGSDDTTTIDKQIYRIDSSAGFASRTGGNKVATLKTGIITTPPDPEGQVFGPLSVKRWNELYPLFVATTTADTNVSFDWEGYTFDAKATQRNISQSIVSSTAEVVRPRTAIAVHGWGIVMTMNYTGQVDHAFNGGYFDFEEAGPM